AADEANEVFLHELTTHIKEKDADFLPIADLLKPERDTSDMFDEDSIDLVEDYTMYKAMTDTLAKPEQSVNDMYEAWKEKSSDKALLYVDNKYTPRFTQVIGENERHPLTAWKLALTFMYTTPGVPYVYQGSVVPMFGKGVPENQSLVQFTFDTDDYTEFYHRVSSLRDTFPALTEGEYESVDSNGAMSVFKRQTEDETIYVAINKDSESRSVTVSDIESGMQLRGVLEEDIVREAKDGTFTIGLPREAADVFVIEQDTGLNWPFIVLVGGIFFLFPILVISIT